MRKRLNGEEKGKNRKQNGSGNDNPQVSQSKSVSPIAPEKNRIRKPHRKNHSGLFGDIGLELFKRLATGGAALVCIIAILYYGVNINQHAQRRRLTFTPINLPNIIGPDEIEPESAPDLFWGSYRPNIFFGMSHRSPHSILFGLAFVSFDGEKISLQHQCKSDGAIKSYNWIEHDGRNYGIQTIISGNNNITVSFVKRPSTPSGGDWSARISLSSVNESLPTWPISLLFYAYLPDISRGRIQSYSDGRELKRLRGFTQELGAFQVNFYTAKDGLHRPTHLAGHCPREDAITAAISSGLALREDHASVFLTGQQADIYGPEVSMSELPANFWITEVTRPGLQPISANRTQSHPRLDVLEVEYVSQASTSSDAVPLVGAEFDKALARHSKKFHEDFAVKFPYDPKGFTEEQIALSKISLSNMLGGIGYFYGTSLITSSILGNTADGKPQVVEYWPTGLFTATPSRSQFPRGFLWDEGFHALLVGRWDVELALQSLGHWLDLINAEGWIPREQILGWEARAAVPSEFIVQSTSVANPPALIIAIEDLLDRREKDMTSEEKALFDRWARLAFPRLRAWFFWFESTQAGELPTAYRWRGRPTDNPHQLNPLTLASGLDDYPRATHPTDFERHLDLRCWMGAFARTLARLATHCEAILKSVSSADASEPFQSAAKEFQVMASQLLDPHRLDELHWDEKHGIFADYGLNTDKVALITPMLERAPVPGEPKPKKVRKVLEEPQIQWISSSIGYVNFFPLFLRILSPASPRLPVVLEGLADPALLWTNHGLRSLAPTSPYYNRANTESDPPYWRGAIWMNMNYLAVESLGYYAHHPETPAAVAKRALELQKKLANAVASTILNEMNRTGVTWERYDDRSGLGLSGHPFNGWTALVSLIMTV